MKLLFAQGPSITVRAALLVIASLTLMTVDHRQQHLDGIRAGISVVLYPLQYLVDLPFAIAGWASDTLAFRQDLITENSDLKEKQRRLEFRLQKFEALEMENQRLRSLLQSASRQWERVLIAEILQVDFDPFRRLVLLNKGQNEGVFEGHPLLDAHGVLGQVVHVSPLSSSAILITDPSHTVPVQINRNGLRTLAVGTGSDTVLDIPHLPNNADIKVGDLLVTSGLGLRFPPGYPVATVSNIEINPSEPYAKVSAKPLAHLKRSRQVLLVWPGEEEQE